VTAQRDVSAFFADLSSWAAEGPDYPSVHRYGPHPDQIADLRDGVDSSRVAVVIHGGFWRAGFTRENTTAVAVALARSGWTTWNLEYRRVGAGGGYPQTLEDVATFCGRLERPAVAIGHSAGGHLALWAAAEGLVGAAVALAGVCDLTAAAAAGLGEGAVVEFLDCDPASAPDADPARRLPLATPATLVHGTCDDRVPIAHARAFAAAANAKLLELDGADHFDIIDPRARWWSAIETAIGAVVS
jgi:acetyl esterase/lipase